MICRGAAPMARYRCADTPDGTAVAIRVPNKLMSEIKRFADGPAPPMRPAGQDSPAAGNFCRAVISLCGDRGRGS